MRMKKKSLLLQHLKILILRMRAVKIKWRMTKRSKNRKSRRLMRGARPTRRMNLGRTSNLSRLRVRTNASRLPKRRRTKRVA
jgi:hypothetical protein